MAYSRRTGIVDQFAGMEDLKNRIIRCVGEIRRTVLRKTPSECCGQSGFPPSWGFPLRKIRAGAIRKMAPRLNMISSERIRTELDKLLCSPHPEYFREVYELGDQRRGHAGI